MIPTRPRIAAPTRHGPRSPASYIAGLLAGLAATLASASPAAAVCEPSPACLEASFPASYAWGELRPGATGNESSEQVVAVASNASWGLRISSDLADGRMREWDGAAYVTGSPKTLANPMQWRLTRIATTAQTTSYQAIGGSAQTIISSQPSTCTTSCSTTEVAVRFHQLVRFDDPPAGANDYRIQVNYEAAQGF